MSRIPQYSASRSTPSTPSSPKKSSTSRPTVPGTPTLRVRPPPSPTPGSTRGPTPTTPSRGPTPTPTRGTPSLRPQASAKNLRSTTPTKITGKPRAATVGRKTQAPVIKDEPPVPKLPTLSVREQIALKRAEVQKALKEKAGAGGDAAGDDFQGLEDASPTKDKEDIIDLGRWSVRETIEQGRNTGAVNLASRDLLCLPSALFEIHLGVTPEPLKSVPEEPPITTATSDDPIASSSRRKLGNVNGPSWFEGKDLEILKAWSNEIIEIQPEISMFGSLKTIDLHNNKLAALPDAFADLMSLAHLDLSHNEFTSLPSNLWVMPSLTMLNLSYNLFATLPFSAPLTPSSNPQSRTVDSRGDWYEEAITRASTPLPKLTSLNVSHNELTASGFDHGHLPASLTKLDISFNPLGNSTILLQALAKLVNLQELRAELANIADDSFQVDMLVTGASAMQPFPRLRLLDVGHTQVTLPVIEAAFRPALIKQKLEYDLTNEPPQEGVLQIVVGKKVIKEAWELEIERRTRLRNARHTRTDSVQSSGTTVSNGTRAATPKGGGKESWEIDAEQGLLTEGGKRRQRAAAAAQAAADLSLPPSATSSTAKTVQPVKEAWEIEAEQGLSTAGGRRRARALAAVAAAEDPTSTEPSPTASPTTSSHVSATDALSSPQYYNSTAKSLTLPPSSLPSRAAHFRSFSLAPKIPPSGSMSDFSLAIPTPTLPLTTIVSSSFSDSLSTLILSQRRMDTSFNLPTSQGPFLPHLGELRLDNCSLNDTVPICKDGTSARTNEPLLPTLARLFPSVKILDLSYNNLTSAAFGEDVLANIILASDADDGSSPRRAGLRQLILRGNRITEVDSFQSVAKLFKGYKEKKDVETFKLEELDLRDNEIAKLSPELGLLPLDVLLVDGNVYVQS
ncbi:hypothetical protein EUX98_g8389 [Antrodiella citrinella]|uniref:L domain-like protein n=1 Tax=Antrodiella citrinella TaxID=2447956 RepID=A0A4S4MEA4_9APHY|nr:hypothetical protein EUX98_g8389 [Antrodiella citrinella]